MIDVERPKAWQDFHQHIAGYNSSVQTQNSSRIIRRLLPQSPLYNLLNDWLSDFCEEEV